ncbi:hypothetical protein A6A05_13885 [Magnetospirillum moscoviense]|uniref:Uncharacterized protein n=1 Tax=Magnetospirillum moscoviense TaxID=1437059 RepID=A0A178ML23_9PROT|nr:hypothetical protein A6A05_13885 [Magnetospirillum moscoviense]
MIGGANMMLGLGRAPVPVIPAKAGIQGNERWRDRLPLDARLRGHDDERALAEGGTDRCA